MNITVLVSCIFLIREKRDACSLKKLFTMEKKKDDNQYKFGLNPGTIYLLKVGGGWDWAVDTQLLVFRYIEKLNKKIEVF